MAGSKRAEKNSSLKKYIVADKYAGMTVDVYVKDVMQESARKRQKLFFNKGIYVNGKAAHSKRVLNAGDMVAVRQFKDSSYGVTPEDRPVDVLYEDKDLLVVNKPAGMLVHPAGQTTSGTLANYLAMYFKKKGQVVTIRAIHRLDRDTAGCVLVAKSGKIQTELEEMLAAGQIHRGYEAVVEGTDIENKYPDGIIDAKIGKDIYHANSRMVTDKGQRAVTHFQVLAKSDKFSHLALQLETGRTHQIRVHLAYAGKPVLGDAMYGQGRGKGEKQALHAVSIEFTHPVTGEAIKVKAPRPKAWEKYINIFKRCN